MTPTQINLTAAAALLVLAFAAPASAKTHKHPAPETPAESWVGTWAASQQVPEPANSLAPEELRDATLRQIVHLSIGGAALRVHLSNAFGTEPLRITSAHIALPLSADTSQIIPATDKELTFAGSASVIIPAGAEYISDRINFLAAPLSNLAITIHYYEPPAGETGHPGSRATSYLAHGDEVSAPDLPDAKKIGHWYQIAGVDVIAPPSAAAIVTLGDSITDGQGATINGNDRWPDVLAERLQAAPETDMLGVLNQGMDGNHLLVNGLGPNALARFDRDVLAQSGARYLIVLEGVDDLGGLTRLHEVSTPEHLAFVHQVIAAYQQIIVRAHARGIKVIGATMLPYAGSEYYHPGPPSETDRQTINLWIRTPGHFDAVIDFDKAMSDPDHPDRLLPEYDSGDHLHPSPDGYRVMGEATPLSLFAQQN